MGNDKLFQVNKEKVEAFLAGLKNAKQKVQSRAELLQQQTAKIKEESVLIQDSIRHEIARQRALLDQKEKDLLLLVQKAEGDRLSELEQEVQEQDTRLKTLTNYEEQAERAFSSLSQYEFLFENFSLSPSFSFPEIKEQSAELSSAESRPLGRFAVSRNADELIQNSCRFEEEKLGIGRGNSSSSTVRPNGPPASAAVSSGTVSAATKAWANGLSGSSSKSSTAAPTTSTLQLARSVFVSNLPYSTTEEEIRANFAPFGNITSINIRGIPIKGYAFVDYESPDAVKKALKGAQDTPILFGKRRAVVDEKKPRDLTSPRPAEAPYPSTSTSQSTPPFQPDHHHHHRPPSSAPSPASSTAPSPAHSATARKPQPEPLRRPPTTTTGNSPHQPSPTDPPRDPVWVRPAVSDNLTQSHVPGHVAVTSPTASGPDAGPRSKPAQPSSLRPASWDKKPVAPAAPTPAPTLTPTAIPAPNPTANQPLEQRPQKARVAPAPSAAADADADADAV